MKKANRLFFAACLLPFLAGCHTDQWREPKEAPLDMNEFFADGQASRPLVPGTIAQGHLREDDAFYVGAVNNHWIDQVPIKFDGAADLKKFLLRGQERFNIYCTPCHGRLGNGEGMIAHRGFALRRPVGNYQTDRLRKMPLGHFYDVITNGYGAMFSYAARVEPRDRWAIAAYIRALQLSQNATPDQADPAELSKLQAQNTPQNGALTR